MSADTTGHWREEHLGEQFEDRRQQDEAYTVGMWTFLATEVMFFGALFVAYTVYRTAYPAVFHDAHHHLNVPLGALNTAILLTSSLTMALAVRAAQLNQRKLQMILLAVTMAFALGFLVVKGFEWAEKYHDHLVPGSRFVYEGQTAGEPINAEAIRRGEGASPADPAQMFFSLYFAMTGLHAVHVIVGVLVMLILLLMRWRDHPSVRYYMPTEMAGLYWHFVDVVWIFLFPLFYLIPR